MSKASAATVLLVFAVVVAYHIDTWLNPPPNPESSTEQSQPAANKQPPKMTQAEQAKAERERANREWAKDAEQRRLDAIAEASGQQMDWIAGTRARLTKLSVAYRTENLGGNRRVCRSHYEVRQPALVKRLFLRSSRVYILRLPALLISEPDTSHPADIVV